MTKGIDPTTALHDLAKFDWFRNVGVRDVPDAEFVDSWSDAIENCDSLEWDNYQLDGMNALGGHLLKVDPDRAHTWNKVVTSLRPIVRSIVERKTSDVMARNGLDRSFYISVESDIYGFALEVHFGDVVPPALYSMLAESYRAGHFPCGWKGRPYPRGKLIVY